MSETFKSNLAKTTFLNKYAMDKEDGTKETWSDLANRVATVILKSSDKTNEKHIQRVFKLINNREFIPAGRYLYATGREFHQVNNCCCLRAEDSREGWAILLHDATRMLMSGAGIGINYSRIRPKGSVIKKTGGYATGAVSLMQIVNEAGRHIVQGGSRRSAIWAGLHWRHGDINEFVYCKNRTELQKKLKAEDWTFPLPMELTNCSPEFDTEFWVAYEDPFHIFHTKAKETWKKVMLNACQTGEPGWSLNYNNDINNLRNACNELVSDEDSDKCNLGSLWLNKFTNIDDFEQAIKYAVLFLMCGGIYSDVPTEKVKEIGEKNNRIGLGLGGISEWLLQRGYSYEVNEELRKYLRVYKEATDYYKEYWAKKLGVNVPKASRAIAPNGSIGLLAETTTAIEPLPYSAYKRRYIVGDTWKTQFCVDPTVKRLHDIHGIPYDKIWDSRDLGFEQRVKFQADIQDYVDMAISSTCNLPAWGTLNNCRITLDEKCDILYKYSKRLRGFTVYPDGAIAGQPLQKCSIEEALESEGVEFEEQETQCKSGVCGA